MNSDIHKDDEEWYRVSFLDPSFVTDMVRLILNTHGERAHLFCLGRILNSEDAEEVLMWKKVLTILDNEKEK